jgi:selenide,water dikinase
VELVLALARRHASRLRLTLIAAGPEPLAEAPSRARRRVRTALAEARVAIRTGVTALRHHDGQLLLSDGSALDAAACLWATGAQGPRFLADAGLDCDRTGCVLVDATLRSVSHDGVFAAGDCAALTASPRPKAGVWAVRAGPPLAENLRRAAASRPPRPWHPQRQALVLLGLGDGRAVGWRNGITVFGPAVWWWKDWLDRRWVRRYARFHEPR